MTAASGIATKPGSEAFKQHWHAFILANTQQTAPPHVPEIRLALATEHCPVWNMAEDELEKLGLVAPYWAFAWAGGQALARYILDNPGYVAGKRVIDVATGSGLVAIAALKSGALAVTANDIDPICAVSVSINAGYNNLAIPFHGSSLTGEDGHTNPETARIIADTDVILAGDVFYDEEMAANMLAWLQIQRDNGKRVLVGDPVRSYFPHDAFTRLATYEVSEVGPPEDQDVKRTHVWEMN